MRRVIIDSDTAGDDTTAILMALKYFKVEGVTIVAGNVAFDQEVENALTTIETYNPGYKVPVYKGYQSPMIALPNVKNSYKMQENDNVKLLVFLHFLYTLLIPYRIGVEQE